MGKGRNLLGRGGASAEERGYSKQLKDKINRVGRNLKISGGNAKGNGRYIEQGRIYGVGQTVYREESKNKYREHTDKMGDIQSRVESSEQRGQSSEQRSRIYNVKGNSTRYNLQSRKAFKGRKFTQKIGNTQSGREKSKAQRLKIYRSDGAIYKVEERFIKQKSQSTEYKRIYSQKEESTEQIDQLRVGVNHLGRFSKVDRTQQQ